MNQEIYKCHIICNIFPQIDDIYLGAVFTPAETLVCCANSVIELKKSLNIATKEVCDYLDGKVTEEDFICDLQEREKIMRGVMAQHGIPLQDDLYKCLFDYFQKAMEIYNPFEDLNISFFENKSVDPRNIKTIGELLSGII